MSREDLEHPWHTVSPDEALEKLGVSRDEGLSDDEAAERRDQFGSNTIQEEQTVSPWRILLNQFTDPLIYVLIGALVVTLSIQSWSDAIVIGAVLLINGTIGFIQEYRAESAVQSLMEMISPKARVRRGGEEREIDSAELVPGDIVEIEQGAMVPADLRLLETEALQVDEAALTGESVPVSKEVEAMEGAEPDLVPSERKNVAFMGTAATSGRARGVVIGTGHATEIGKIAESVQEAGEISTPLQQRIDRLAKWIAGAILILAAVAFGIGWAVGRDLFEMLLTAVALAVAAIPAGLPIVVTVALAIGVNRMAKKEAVIRKLPAVDTLGSCSVIVSDKTGTLTENRMTVRRLAAGGEAFTLEGGTREREGELRKGDEPFDPESDRALYETLLVGLLCNDAEPADDETPEGTGDPMEIALLHSAFKAGLSREDLEERHPRKETIPFRTEQRFMATIHEEAEQADEGPLVLVKGAPERIARMCSRQRTSEGETEDFDPDALVETSEKLAAEGLRVLAMAVGRGKDAADTIQSDEPEGLTFVGLQGLLDPPRESAIEAVQQCHEAGIRVILVTGDHAATASAIGDQVKLGEAVRWREGPAQRPQRTDDDRLEVLTGQDLKDLDDDTFAEKVQSVAIFARVEPTQKLRIVESLREADEIVSVTGDGVNDAPALKSAHLGAAMGSGTDVAKEASDMVITDDNFASVYAAVEEGRTSFRNIRMATFFLLSTGAADVLIILSALVAGWPLPLLPAQILWCNVATNGIQDVALAFEPGERSLVRQPPRPKHEGILNRLLLERLAIVGIWLAVGVLAVFYGMWNGDEEALKVARTGALTTLVLFQMVHVFNCRSEYDSIFRKSLFSNKVLFIGVLASLAAHAAAVYLPWTQELLSLAPLDASHWLLAAGVAATALVVNEVHKRFRKPPEAAA